MANNSFIFDTEGEAPPAAADPLIDDFEGFCAEFRKRSNNKDRDALLYALLCTDSPQTASQLKTVYDAAKNASTADVERQLATKAREGQPFPADDRRPAAAAAPREDDSAAPFLSPLLDDLMPLPSQFATVIGNWVQMDEELSHAQRAAYLFETRHINPQVAAEAAKLEGTALLTHLGKRAREMLVDEPPAARARAAAA